MNISLISQMLAMRSTTSFTGTLPSLRSTLQKYGLQNLLNDNQSMPMLSPTLILSTPISLQPVHQGYRGISAPQAHQSISTPQAQRGISAPQVFRVPAAKVKRKRAKCVVPDCSRVSRNHKLCFIHGGRYYCKFAGCNKCAHKGGFCISHGGGLRCQISDCDTSAQHGGKCYVHGGGRRCSLTACNNARRIHGFCPKHFAVSKA